MKTLETKLGHTFRNLSLLENALTHSSYANEHRAQSCPNNERLEFLGDSVLGFVVADHLFRTHGNLPEGDLTRLRAALVCEGSLVEAARAIDLGAHLRLGRGESLGGGRTRPSILADAMEAVIAAVYLDGGIGQARKLVHALILDRASDGEAAGRDYKTALQELVQRTGGQVLIYHCTDQRGPDHAKTFTVAVELNGEAVGEGEGSSKKEAEQAAARAALARLS